MMSSTCPDSTCRLRDRFGYCTANGPCIAVSNTVRIRVDENKLKHCPFCGEQAKIIQIPYEDEKPIKAHPEWSWQNPGMWKVGCNTYRCFGEIDRSPVFWNEESARNAWNGRKG